MRTRLAAALVSFLAFAPARSFAFSTASGLSTVQNQLWKQSNFLQVSEEGDAFGAATTVGDMNDDGYDDLIVTTPGESTSNPAVDLGSVYFIPGGPAGLVLTGSRRITLPATYADGRCGETVAVGNFDSDDYRELAIGCPGAEVGGNAGAGLVLIYAGSASGPDGGSFDVLSQDTANVSDSAEQDDEFGFMLAVGDFDSDGHDDLVVSTPGEDFNGPIPGFEFTDVGGVAVFYGTAQGLSGTGSQFWDMSTPGVPGSSETGDRMGTTLAVGDFTGTVLADGYDDLAIGLPNHPIDDATNAGEVLVLYGSGDGLGTTLAQVWDQGSTNVPGNVATDQLYGSALAAGDFDADGYEDLAVGVSGFDLDVIGTIAHAGAVSLLRGGLFGLVAQNTLWTELSTGVGGTVAPLDGFGSALAAADFNGDGADDLAIDIPRHTVNGAASAGAVRVLLGAAGGLTSGGNEYWTKATGGITGDPVASDQFGYVLAAGDFDDSGCADLAISSATDPFVPSAPLAGSVQVLYGDLFADGFEAGGFAEWSDTSP